jgi:hypothetical protein
VAGVPSLPCGQSALSGLELITPRTEFEEVPVFWRVEGAARTRFLRQFGLNFLCGLVLAQSFKGGFSIALTCESIAMFDQQPVLPLALNLSPRIRIRTQLPLSLSPLRGISNRPYGGLPPRGCGLRLAKKPRSHNWTVPPPYWPLGIVPSKSPYERMVLDLYGESLIARFKRRPSRNRPGLEEALQFEAKVVMQGVASCFWITKRSRFDGALLTLPLGSSVFEKSRFA